MTDAGTTRFRKRQIADDVMVLDEPHVHEIFRSSALIAAMSRMPTPMPPSTFARPERGLRRLTVPFGRSSENL
jgi:hypothetical protein